MKKQSLAKYNSTIFTEIYSKNMWGGKKGEFYSGSGSYNQNIRGYTKAIANFIIEKELTRIVEIGCGDFNVSGQLLAELDKKSIPYKYTGYDVVKRLIQQNQKLYCSSQIEFKFKDAVSGNIKTGDILIIRQVLQHLNNRSIIKIVKKFRNYKYIIVTEHQISEEYGKIMIPNIDKPTDLYNRVVLYSGVYLDKEPYNCKIEKTLFSFFESQCNLNAYINTILITS